MVHLYKLLTLWWITIQCYIFITRFRVLTGFNLLLLLLLLLFVVSSSRSQQLFIFKQIQFAYIEINTEFVRSFQEETLCGLMTTINNNFIGFLPIHRRINETHFVNHLSV